MVNKSFKISGVLAVFVALVMVFAACAPAVAPGVAPREIPIGPEVVEEAPVLTPETEFGVVEEAPVLTPEVELNEEQRAIAEATTFEDFLSRLDSIAIPLTEEELSALSAGVEMQREEHLVTEFTTGIVTLEDEFISAYGLAPVEQFEEDMALEVAPSEDLLEDIIVPEFAPVEDLGEDIILEFAPVEEPLGVEVAPGVTVIDEQREIYLVDEFGAAEDFPLESAVSGVTITDGEIELFADELAPAEELIVPSLEESAPVVPAIRLGLADLMDGDLVIKTEISGFTLDPEAIGKARVEGSGHWHVYIDGKLAGFSATDNFRVSKDKLAEFGSGLHEIKVELHNNDHSLVSDTAWAGTKLDFGFSMMAPEIEKETKMGGYSY